jgi:hypothetical protein
MKKVRSSIFTAPERTASSAFLQAFARLSRVTIILHCSMVEYG